MRIENIFKKSRAFFLDLFFPKKCLGCGEEETWLCPDCLRKINVRANLLPGSGCLDGVWVSSDYGNPIVQQLIHGFKYQYVTDLAPILAEMMVANLPEQNGNWFLVPVPLHRRRLLERGFNQAELLAQEISRRKNWPVLANALGRTRHVKPQAQLARKDRLINLRDVFVCRPNNSLVGQNIFLVDDVMTTGATLSEGAKVLKQNGANLVRGLVIAHG